jgi:uncharacterized protein
LIERAAPVALAALAILIAPLGVAAQQEFPRFSAPIVDAADVVDDDAEERINAQLLSYQRRSGNQVAVAVVETLGRASIEDYAEDLFDAWAVGEKDKDNGVLLVIAMQERDLRIEVGYGVEGDLTDIESGDIVDKMAPLMRGGDVGGAIALATNDIRLALGDTEAVPLEETEEEDEGRSPFSLLYLLFPLLFIFGGLGGRRRGRRRRDFSMWPILLGGAWGASGGSGGGVGGGGFGGGGFGGGGGGGSGGGGASGGW